MRADVMDVLHRHVASTVDAVGNEAAATAIQAWVDRRAEVLVDDAVGAATLDPYRPLDVSTPLDLASLTKVFTATLAMVAVDRGLVAFDSRAPELGDVTLLHLMNHSSGLPAWDRFYERMPMNPTADVAVRTRAAIRREISAVDREPAGLRGVYSDLGYLYLGFWLEDLFDSPLDEAVARYITTPLDLPSIRYVSLARGDAPIATAAATEIDPRRGGAVVGTVHDENCHIIGGVAGHAGLFGNARDVGRFGRHLLAIEGGDVGIVRRDTLRFCWSEAARGGDGHHLGGWDTPSGERSSAGRGFHPAHTVGHLGFTGTSIWIERHADIVAVLLTNRVFPTRENPRIKDLRVEFHEAIVPPPGTDACT